MVDDMQLIFKVDSLRSTYFFKEDWTIYTAAGIFLWKGWSKELNGKGN